MRRSISQLVFWLMMLALPLQGWAAASMLYCAPLSAPVAAHQRPPMAHHGGGVQVAAVEQHDHSLHASAGAAHHPADDGSLGATSAAQGHNPHDATHTVAKDQHKCSAICAACLNLAAVVPTMTAMPRQTVPQLHGQEPLSTAYSAPTRLPEKPPRA